MPRRGSEWDRTRDALLSVGGMTRETKSVEERERVPEKACGKCKRFFSSTSRGGSGGSCDILKVGSNITKDPPLFVTEGEANYWPDFKMDASRCKYYDEMEFIETDISQAHDPRFSRPFRQMGK
ncbi:MAG: hypothetical protein IBX36_05910 [Dehalococcoidia bacterium]|nr:hypothetical protein [Dehalococcoidia bacterium]